MLTPYLLKKGRMIKKNLVGLLAVTFILVTNICHAENNYQLALTGEALQQSIITYDQDEFGPIKVITKTWNETFDARSRFDVSFYGKFTDAPVPRRVFLETIKTFDGQKEIQVHEQDGADCSWEKLLLVNKDKAIYLVLAFRMSTSNSTTPIPLSEPAPQLFKLFKLVRQEENKPATGLGKPRAFFDKIREKETENSMCTSDEIYPAMQNFVAETLK